MLHRGLPRLKRHRHVSTYVISRHTLRHMHTTSYKAHTGTPCPTLYPTYRQALRTLYGASTCYIRHTRHTYMHAKAYACRTPSPTRIALRVALRLPLRSLPACPATPQTPYRRPQRRLSVRPIPYIPALIDALVWRLKCPHIVRVYIALLNTPAEYACRIRQ